MKKFKLMICLVLMCSTLSINTYALTEKIPLDTHIQFICREVGEEFNICPTTLMALVYVESRGQHKNLTQITNPKWFAEGTEELNLKNPKTNRYENVRLCAYYLNKWCEETEDIGYALECWNKGQNNVKQGSYSYYSKKITELSAEWEQDFYESEAVG